MSKRCTNLKRLNFGTRSGHEGGAHVKSTAGYTRWLFFNDESLGLTVHGARK
jgi:hypothetical protein